MLLLKSMLCQLKEKMQHTHVDLTSNVSLHLFGEDLSGMPPLVVVVPMQTHHSKQGAFL